MDLSKYSKQMKGAIKELQKNLSSIRTGKASRNMVNDIDIFVKKYSSSQQLSELANISVLDSNTIKIQPWDKSIVDSIEKGIRDSNIGLNPLNKWDYIMIKVPQITTERRKELAEKAKQQWEKARVKIRNIRKDAKRQIKEKFEDDELTKDQKIANENQLNDLTDKYNNKIDEKVQNKADNIKKTD